MNIEENNAATAFEKFLKERRDHSEGLTARQQLWNAFDAGAKFALAEISRQLPLRNELERESRAGVAMKTACVSAWAINDMKRLIAEATKDGRGRMPVVENNSWPQWIGAACAHLARIVREAEKWE